ncbi:MAG: hypothetical protein DMF88_02315 [Acidobacteria bacterium]|nr:MAG: hypothetical protein DMF88_02315 [Acidobacteriota bacterium]
MDHENYGKRRRDSRGAGDGASCTVCAQRHRAAGRGRKHQEGRHENQGRRRQRRKSRRQQDQGRRQ